MAGSITLTSTPLPGSDGIVKHAMAWTADGAGNVSGNTLTFPFGTIVTVEFIPGTAANLYDVDFLDANSASMFNDGTGQSIGANLSNAVGVHRAPMIVGSNSTPVYVRSWLHGGSYQLTVANAGAAAAGTVNLYLCPRTL